MRGFLFEHSRADVTSPLGVRRTKIAAIAASRSEAFSLAGDILPLIGIRLFDEGPDAFRIAQEAGVKDGEAKALD